jgi:hypothetical protein
MTARSRLGRHQSLEKAADGLPHSTRCRTLDAAAIHWLLLGFDFNGIQQFEGQVSFRGQYDFTIAG